MEVLFVHSAEDYYTDTRPLPNCGNMQFGISYISAVLKEAGHSTRLVVLTPHNTHKLDEYIEKYNPGLICFTSVYSVYALLAQAAAHVKRRYPDVFLSAGGPHVWLNPDDCLKDAFDAVCVGEGEYPTLELVEMLEAGREPKGIPNLYIKRNGSIERNTPRPFISDLDSLPFPDRAMWVPWYFNPLSNPGVLAGRGCPFKCTYCCNHAFRRASDGRFVRTRTSENIVREIQGIKAVVPGLEDMVLEAETLGCNVPWALELCDALEVMNKGFATPVRLCTNLRVTHRGDYDTFFEALARAGFFGVNIGLESGSERVRKEILHRDYSNEDIERAVRSAKEHGLQVGFYNLIGLPGETREEFRETVQLNRRCQPDWWLLSVFYPYPGTSLHDTCKDMGLIDAMPDPSLERRRPVLEQPAFTRRQVRREYIWSFASIHRGYRPAWECAWRVFLTRVFSNQKLLRLWRRIESRISPSRKFQLLPPP